ncbi:prepilin-type N-terminal cleavage/methylation domain-containing protein [Vibrio sp. RE86]|uniref:GspH/FimT family pseudopilin n=1 Tax=Vibrio sp. RE86 TaxID=2607605 RepID=UPI001493A49C|nr:GspH/FimT family pseudopilin [Vibrio sp. RE86]NOH79007.1 prepilin-type N-terminal cleavage/methylation domain-containing protein [Vibrio sp. RE86]
MSRGFTLFELVITLIVLGTLLVVAVPSFTNINNTSQMKRLADELQGFLIYAKSEAVWRNKDLWAHLSTASNPSPAGEWTFTLTDSDTENSGNKLMVLDGSSYKDIVMVSGYTSEQIKFDGVRGKIKDGHLRFYVRNQTDKVLRLKGSFGGSRILVCGEGGTVYEFPSC